MTFCPRCGASLKVEPTAAPRPPMPPPAYRNEKGEKREKNEPEKGEKHEKGEYGYIGWLVGGIIVLLLGFLGLAAATGYISSAMNGALVLLVIGIVVIIIAVWLSTMARRRHPAPPA